MWEYLVNLFLEMLHHQMVLLLPILVLGLGLKSTQLTSVSGPETVGVFGQAH